MIFCRMPYSIPNHSPAWATRTRRSRQKQRLSAARRGYGRPWRRYRLWYLGRHPLCVHCERDGRAVAATEVDHRDAVDGPDDPRFWDPENHQGLCKPCHARKTVKEDGALGR